MAIGEFIFKWFMNTKLNAFDKIAVIIISYNAYSKELLSKLV